MITLAPFLYLHHGLNQVVYLTASHVGQFELRKEIFQSYAAEKQAAKLNKAQVTRMTNLKTLIQKNNVDRFHMSTIKLIVGVVLLTIVPMYAATDAVFVDKCHVECLIPRMELFSFSKCYCLAWRVNCQERHLNTSVKVMIIFGVSHLTSKPYDYIIVP